MIYFNKRAYKDLVMAKYTTYENYSRVLTEHYHLKKGKTAVTKWGQETNPNVPTANDLPIIAESLNVTINDLFENAEKSNEKVIKNALKNPSKKIKEMLDNYFENSTYIKGDIIEKNNNGHSVTYLQPDKIKYDQMLEEIIEVLQNDKNLKRDVYFLVFRDEIKNKEKL